MYDLSDELQDLVDLLNKHATGLTYEELWSKCNYCVYKKDLSLNLSYLIRNDYVVKNKETGIYQLSNETYYQLNNKPLPESKAVEKKYGDLDPTITIGGIALLLYKTRHSKIGITYKDMVENTYCKEKNAWNAVRRLLNLGYCIKVHNPESRRHHYRWSNRYCYPFMQERESDMNLLRL